MTGKYKLKFGWNRLRFYFSFLLLIFYLVVGFMFVFTETWADLLPDSRFFIGIFLMLFGVARFYVSYRRFINKKLRITTQKEKHESSKPD
jgi:hypothetical protein